MLGQIAEDMPAVAERDDRARPRAADAMPRIAARNLAARHRSCSDVSFDLYPGEVLGVVALEGQGQDELFDILCRLRCARPSGELLVDGRPVAFRHPADAIRAGLVYVPADRAEALLMQRSVRENIALPWTAPARTLGPRSRPARSARRRRRDQAACRSTRAPQGEVRRLSGGNQQKVTIARWVAGGVHTMLCFDPTRGIDIRTKQQIYVLLRDLAEAGAGGPALHVRAQGDPARLRPDDRHLRRSGRRRDRRSRTPTSRRCCGPPTTCKLGRARCPRRSRPRSSPPWPRPVDDGRRRGDRPTRPSTCGRAAAAAGSDR